MDITLLLQEERKLRCTQKAIDALLSNTLLKGRTRQYCLLLNNTDSISLKLRDKLSLKVDLLYLFNNKFVTLNTVACVDVGAENTTINTVNTAAATSINQPIVIVEGLDKQDSTSTLKTVFTTSSSSKYEGNHSQKDTSPVSPLLQFASGSF